MTKRKYYSSKACTVSVIVIHVTATALEYHCNLTGWNRQLKLVKAKSAAWYIIWGESFPNHSQLGRHVSSHAAKVVLLDGTALNLLLGSWHKHLELIPYCRIQKLVWILIQLYPASYLREQLRNAAGFYRNSFWISIKSLRSWGVTIKGV